jgi:hypothetical protein
MARRHLSLGLYSGLSERLTRLQDEESNYCGRADVSWSYSQYGAQNWKVV